METLLFRCETRNGKNITLFQFRFSRTNHQFPALCFIESLYEYVDGVTEEFITISHGPSSSNKFIYFSSFFLFFFSVRMKILKGGNIVAAQMGDANASIPTPQPVYMRPMFSSLGKAAADCSIAFVSRRCLDTGVGRSYGLGTYALTMKLNR